MIILAVVIAVVISVAISYFIMIEAVKRCIDLVEQSDDFTYDVMRSHIDKWHKGD